MTSPFAPVRSFTPFPPAAGARILSFGGHQPGHVVTNDDLAAQVDTNDEWIRSRVGVVSRRIAGPDESVTDMAFVAGGKALAGSGLSPADIDLVIVATCSTEASIPNVSAVVAHRLGIVAPGAYDLNAACAGFCYALANAADSIRAGTARHVLVIGAEKMSAWIDFTDRSTCIIFADGAGAAVVGPVADGEPPGIGPVVWGSAGDLSQNITIADRNSSLHQEGQAVFRWATTAMHPIAAQACERAGVAVSDLAAFVPHQANLRIIEAIARKLGVPRERVADDIVHSGNTSSASIPLALSTDDRARGPQAGLSGAATRIRRGAVLRGAGDHGTLAAPCRAGWSPVGRDSPATGQKTRANTSDKEQTAMNDQEILAGLGEIVEEIAGVPADEVTPSKSFVDDLDIDSLSMVEIAVAAQDKFGVEIPDDQLKDLSTVQDVVNFVSKNAGGSA